VPQTPIFDALLESITACRPNGQKPKRVVVGKDCAAALLKEHRVRMCDPKAPLPKTVCDLPLEVASSVPSTSWVMYGKSQ